MKIENDETGMPVKIEDIGLAEIKFTNFGSNLVFYLQSTYDGSRIGTIDCHDVQKFLCKNFDDELFGSYIALVKTEKLDDINDYEFFIKGSRNDPPTEGYRLSMESGSLLIEVICKNIVVNMFKE